ncbi:MAG: sigma-54 dependent transcriptional regulator [Thermodesulfovibrionales bacterium]|nr:sigma-54 dependent transcriptional regulator [Thermodesulfovibrionales bacterium]
MTPNSSMLILVIDDEDYIRLLIKKELSNNYRTVLAASSAKEGLSLFNKKTFDVVLLDIRLPDGDGIELLDNLRASQPDCEVIIITGHGDIESAVSAMKKGAYDYITKPFSLERLELVVDKAFQRVCLQRENRLLKQFQVSNKQPILIGKSESIKQIKYLIQKVAPTDAPVLITGESGTGKDIVARLIHTQSLRKDKHLIIKNCATLQKELIRSELFGYIKGAYTGAMQSQDGLIVLAQGGTLFLDEIGELPLDSQSALLRLLENKTYRRVGEKQERYADVRFLFATNKDLSEEVKAGRFNEALYHRINVIKIYIPPLRERIEDIPLLVEYFLSQFSTHNPSFILSEDIMQHLLNYHWPGNIRELRNVIERAVILAENGKITEHCLPTEMAEKGKINLKVNSLISNLLPLQTIEKQYILHVLESVSGNRSKAAEVLGISRKTLYRKLKEYLL